MPHDTNGGSASDRRQEENTADGEQATSTAASGDGSNTTGPQNDRRDLADWFANGTIRLGIVLIGFLLLLFALGQAFGLGLLDMFVAAVTSQTGRWLVVAAFALLLIYVGQQSVQFISLGD